MSNTIGKMFKITNWGESHGKAIGVVIDGCPSLLNLKEKEAKKRYKILAFELFSGMPIMEHPEKEGTFFAMHLDTALYAMEKI